jgi:hypothetical protein
VIFRVQPLAHKNRHQYWSRNPTAQPPKQRQAWLPPRNIGFLLCIHKCFFLALLNNFALQNSGKAGFNRVNTTLSIFPHFWLYVKKNSSNLDFLAKRSIIYSWQCPTIL